MSEKDIESPCIGVCTIDETSGFCQGCFRTLEEIQGWWDMDNASKAAVVKTAAERESAAFD